MPTGEQWQLAARWLGTNKPTKGSLKTRAIATRGKDNKTYYWTPGDYASGATEDSKNVNETARVAWYNRENAQTVCTKTTNVLKICDMSGNVGEWQFTSIWEMSQTEREIEIRGGGWDDGRWSDYSNNYVSLILGITYAPSYNLPDVGFRVARTSL